MTATAPVWTPPPGPDSEMLPVGESWDAVRAPSYLGERALVLLRGRSGPVICDPYGHRLYWLLPPRATVTWGRLPQIDVYGDACWIEVPPGDRLRGLGPYWRVPPADGRPFTDPGLLHDALGTVVRDAFGPRAGTAVR